MIWRDYLLVKSCFIVFTQGLGQYNSYFGNLEIMTLGGGIFAEEFPVYGFDHIIFHNFQPLRRICAEEPFVLVQSPKN